ncbi:hypothetical protein AZE42_10865 [Rhizopogon vesiculosus]|uniref:Uncharacterized protein n=1 Tax=Rhizopogon vesiculosus TaxID=180088 RepID=A0A1J8Q879_9AGAM|nr:hypothetical protein AZE42_10865 [Rhizopogon vesiculosus]
MLSYQPDGSSYFPDGKQIITVSWDKTVWRWDLQAGMEIEKARKVCEYGVRAVAVSGDNRWVVTAGLHGELTAWEVETGIVKTFHRLHRLTAREVKTWIVQIFHGHSQVSGSGSATSQFAKLDGRLGKFEEIRLES